MGLVDYRQEILDCLNRHTLGLTITEISKEINGNRNTVSKYLSRLEKKNLVFKKEIGKASLFYTKDIESKILYYIKERAYGVTISDTSNELRIPREEVRNYINTFMIQNKIYSKKIGAYNMYFSSEKNFIHKKFLVTLYKAILSNMSKKIHDNKEDFFKEIGQNIFGDIDVASERPVHIAKRLEDFKNNPIKELHFEVFKDIFPAYYIFESIDVSDPKISKTKNKAVFRLTNSEFLTNFDDSLYHFNVISGIIESKMSTDLGVPITCNIETIHISDKKEESHVDLSIEFK
ncbi:MAG: winged helix-turn-helix domain-containing protein [Candidatus Hodarchaeota archaeon]